MQKLTCLLFGAKQQTMSNKLAQTRLEFAANDEVFTVTTTERYTKSRFIYLKVATTCRLSTEALPDSRINKENSSIPHATNNANAYMVSSFQPV